MTRRRSTWGTIAQISRTSWRIRFRVGSERRSETVHGTRRMAELRLAELRAEHDRGRNAPSVPTVREIYMRDIRPLEARLAPDTRRAREYAWASAVDPTWGRVPVDRVTAAAVQDWLCTLSGGTAVKGLAIMRAVCARAALLGVAPDAIGNVKFTMPAHAHRPEKAVTDAAPYLAAVRGTPLEAAVTLMLCAGLRVGEALAVRGCDVRGADGCAVVAVADSVDESGSRRGRVKTRESVRTAVVAPPWAARIIELAREAGDGTMSPDGCGGTIGQQQARRAWMRALDAAGLPRVTLQALRPSWATATLDAGASPRTVNVLMGHTSLSGVLQEYDRPTVDPRTAPRVWDQMGPGATKPQVDGA